MVLFVVACLGLLTFSQATTLLIKTADSADTANDVITTAGEVSEDVSADVSADVGTEESATSGDYGTGPLGFGIWDMFSGFMKPNKKKPPTKPRPRPGTTPRPGPRPGPEMRPRPDMRPPWQDMMVIQKPVPPKRRPSKKPAWLTHKKKCNSPRPCSLRKLDNE